MTAFLFGTFTTAFCYALGLALGVLTACALFGVHL
jgi:hypothetical protein